MSSLGRQVRSVGVLAAWCESDSHLIEPDKQVLQFLSEASRRQLCEYLAEAWDPAKSLPADVRSVLEARALEALQRDPDTGSSQQRFTAAEISQRSVDLLLREYYNMVQAQQRTAPKSADGGLEQRLFLLMCPSGPDWCDLQHLLSAAADALATTAWLVVVLACLIVPAWLSGIRELLRQEQQGQAAALFVGGLAAMLVSDALQRRAAAARAAAAAATVTAGDVQRCLATGPVSLELATLRQASKTATTAKHSRHSQGQQQQQQQQQSAAAPAPRGSAFGHAYMSLLPELAALKTAVGVKSEPPTSREELQQELRQLCGVLGVAISPDMLASPEAMAATISRVKAQVGV